MVQPGDPGFGHVLFGLFTFLPAVVAAAYLMHTSRRKVASPQQTFVLWAGVVASLLLPFHCGSAGWRRAYDHKRQVKTLLINEQSTEAFDWSLVHIQVHLMVIVAALYFVITQIPVPPEKDQKKSKRQTRDVLTEADLVRKSREALGKQWIPRFMRTHPHLKYPLGSRDKSDLELRRKYWRDSEFNWRCPQQDFLRMREQFREVSETFDRMHKVNETVEAMRGLHEYRAAVGPRLRDGTPRFEELHPNAPELQEAKQELRDIKGGLKSKVEVALKVQAELRERNQRGPGA